jgi:LysM repeat protein
MSRRAPIPRWILLAAVVALAPLLPAPAQTVHHNEERVKRLAPQTRQQLGSLTALSARSLQQIAADAAADRVEQRTRQILALGNLAVGSRDHDADGRAPIHRWLHEQIAALQPHGVEYIGSLRGWIAAPVALHRLQHAPAPNPAAITVGEQSWPVLPLWPNGAMPSLCPEDGLSGPLVYVGRGGWDDLHGLDLDGMIALMRFEGGRNWERLFSLGAQAVVVVEDEHVNREKAEALFCNTPVPFPRFYADQSTAAQLRARASRKQFRPDGGYDILPGQTAQLQGGNLYENRPYESLFAYLPPTTPLQYTVRPADLLERIAAEFGVNVEELMTVNRLSGPELAEGQTLAIPNSTRRYSVRRDDLITRIASSYGLAVEDIETANQLARRELEAGQTLTIPNFGDTLVVLAPIDSVSVVPDGPHGANTAGNLAVALTALEHLAMTDPIVRRKGVLFGFLDAETLGGASSRAFAEHVLLSQNALRSFRTDQPQQKNILGVVASATMLLLIGALAGLAGRYPQHRGRSAAERRALLTRYCVAGAVLTATAAGVVAGAAVVVRNLPGQELDTLGLYHATARWLHEPASAKLTADQAQWFGEKWLKERIEERRVHFAEQRIAALLATRDATDPAEKQRHQAELAAAQQQLDFIVELRQATLENRALAWPERTQQFRQKLTQAEREAVPGALPLSWAAFQQRLEAEYHEERTQRELATANTALAQRLREKLHGGDPGRFGKPVLGWYLDVSAGSHSLGITAGAPLFRAALPAAAQIKNFENRFRDVIAYASVHGGWPEDWTFVAADDRLDYTITPTSSPPIYAEFWAAGDVALLPLITLNDRLERLDTPHDVVEHTNFRNLALQTRTVLLIARMGLESAVDSLPPADLKKPLYGRVGGRALQFNIRSGIDARDPIAGAYVYYPSIRSGAIANLINTATHRGARRGTLMIARLNGGYTLPLETLGFSARPLLHAYHLDRRAALFDKVMDAGRIGTQTQSPEFKLLDGRELQKHVVLTDVYPLVFFPGPDPMDYRAIGDQREKQQIRVVDAVLNGEPQRYGFTNPIIDYLESDVTANMLYLPPGRRARFLVQRNIVYKLLLVGPLDVDNPRERGAGYTVGPGPDGARNLTLPMTPLRVARDMQALAQQRHTQYLRFGITDQTIGAALERSAEKIAEAEAALARQDWQAATGAAREGWGILVKFYPRILRLAREAVFSVVMLMALLVPAAVFLERLTVGSKTIVGHLLGVTAMFLAGVVFLNYFHPAFQISVSPLIVVIAFTMILMAAIVLTLCYQRFEVLVRRARIAGGEAESEEISLGSSLATALNLGVSNLKKRMARTVLTAMTVSVLTFSIVAFVSVRGQDTLSRRPVALDADVEGRRVQPLPPAYQGVLFREFFWVGLPETFVSAIRSEFGTKFEATTRGYYIERPGGNNMDREGVNQIELRRGKQTHILTGIMAFEPNETRFSALHEAVSGRQWFLDEDRGAGRAADRFTVILPDEAARALGITEQMLLDQQGRRRPEAELPLVRMMNLEWRVIGILDTDLADRKRDLTGKSLAMVDYLRSAFTDSAAEAGGDVVNEPDSYHMSWRHFAIVPMAAAGDVNARPRSVAFRFEEADQETIAGFYQDVALRLNRSMFGIADGQLALLTTKKQQSVSGVAKIIVPVILCILIVGNTMMGNVEERKGEVGMLGAVGLSPAQISFLLLSESTVFSVLGIVFGTFGGLLFANLVPWVAANFGGALGGLSFNFTSMTSVALAMATGLVVLLATLAPARKAAALAAPSGMAKWELPPPGSDSQIEFDLPFNLTRGNAVGMIAFFRRFLLNHTESTSPDFNCRNIVVSQRNGTAPALVVRADMWLSPYDLDVAQHLEMEVLPGENPGVFGVRINLHRTSGTEEAWLRTNYGFMDLVRRQFLLWRYMEHTGRDNYIEEGARLLQKPPA